MYELIWSLDQADDEAYSLFFSCLEAVEAFQQSVLELYPNAVFAVK
jgi:hypothetical protein